MAERGFELVLVSVDPMETVRLAYRGYGPFAGSVPGLLDRKISV
jgi:hypothetical protein